MNKKHTSDFVWGIIGNIVASLLIALANILVGRFVPNAPREVLDVSSSILPLLIIFVFLYRGKIRRIRMKQIHIEPSVWLLPIRRLLTQVPQKEQIKQFFHRLIGRMHQFALHLSEISRQTKNWATYFEKAIKPSVIIVTVVTVFLIVGFGVSIRWLFEQRTISTLPPVYSSYRQIYDLLAP